jgi:hypothetical protein
MDMSQILFAPGAIAPGNPPAAPVPQAPGVNPGDASAPPGGTDAAAPQLPDLDSQDKGGFFEKVRSDPAFSQAMLMMGSRLMQGMKPGQDEYGMMGDAAMIGMTAHNMAQANARTNKIQDDRISREVETHDAQMEASQANTAATKQQTEQRAELFPETKAKLAQEVLNLRSQGRLNDAQALIAEFKSDPKRLSQMWDLDIADKRASTNAHNASAANSNAQAGFNSERTAAAKALNAEGDSNAVLHGNRGATAVTEERIKALEKTLRKAYTPEEKSDAEISKMAANSLLEKKGGDAENLRWLAENHTDKATRTWASNKLAESQGFPGSKGATPGKGAAAPTNPDGVAERFAADPAMKGNTLGAKTPKGMEVKDAKGKVIGYFN